MKWWLNGFAQYFAPEQNSGSVPGSRQEEGGTPAATPAKTEAARKQVENKLKGLNEPPADSSVPPAPPSAEEDPFVTLELSDGRKQEVKRSYALEKAARAEEAEKKAAEAEQRYGRIRHLESLQAWLEQNPDERVSQLQNLVSGKVSPPPQSKPESTPPGNFEDEDGLLRSLHQPSETPPQADPQLLARIEKLEQDRQQEAQRQQAQNLEGYRQQLFESCREKMKNFRVFQNGSWRTLGEDKIRTILANDAVLAQLEDPGIVVQKTAELFESVAQKQAMKDARDIRRARALSGGVAPGPTSARSKERKVIADDQRVRDHGVKQSIVQRLIQD
jgi:hypothetical protein